MFKIKDLSYITVPIILICMALTSCKREPEARYKNDGKQVTWNTKDIGVGKQNQVFVADLKETPDGKTVIDFSPGKGPGNWNIIRNGRRPFFYSQYPGDRNLKPGTTNFEYKYTLFILIILHNNII